jgi:inner membrane protein
MCHTLCGLALARAGGDRLGPLATPALVVAANFPDIDVVGAIGGGKPWYLCNHRGLTHALVGLAVEAVVLAAIFYAVGRWRGQAVRFRGLLLAAGLGLLSHLALDGLNTYGIRPWLPFVEDWIYLDIAFIADPWLWLCFGGAACLAAPRAGWSAATWSMLVAFGSLFVWTHPLSSAGIALPWTIVAAVFLLGRFKGWGERRPQVAWAGLGLALIYLMALWGLGRTADDRARTWVEARHAVNVAASTCHPAAGVPWRFRVVVDVGTRLHAVDVDLRRDRLAEASSLDTGRELPALSLPEVQASPEYRAWRVFARHPYAAILDGVLVLGDGRYSSQPEDAWCNFLVPLPGAPR